MKLSLYSVDEDYLEYLREYDSKISYTLNANKNRPFICILISDNKTKYCVPLTSKQKNYNRLLTEPIGPEGQYGYLLFNNMFPVKDENIKRIDLKITKKDSPDTIKLKLMRKIELKFINNNSYKIINKAKKIRDKYTKLSKTKLNEVICNFPLLEEKYIEFNKSQLEPKDIKNHVKNKIIKKIININKTKSITDD